MSKKNRAKPTAPAPVSAPTAVVAAAGSAPADAGVEAPAAEHVAWMDSPDPRKRLIGQIAYVAVWIYVAALCLLALDQTFHWGIFGPKVPPVP
ncbi:MAG: hypothetical protein HZA93_25945 [Verrucomicrobia bacterium]|nr:hypothetical protein [Verrucomicrobiota bacterium]